MAAAALLVALGGALLALGGVLVAALGRARARGDPEGPRLGREARKVAHRGGAGERIENTMEAFENAVSQGCDWLELDVRRTRDGAVVVCHDRELSRQSGRRADVTQLDYRDLPPYRCPLEVEFDPGHFSRGCDRRVPRLVEVFQRFPRQPISVEIKDDDDDLINEVAALVRRFDRAPITLWASFRERILRKCRRAHPAMPFCFSLERGLLVRLLWSCRLLPLLRLREAALLAPLPSRIFWPRPPGLVGRVLSRFLLAPPLFRHLRSRGIQVWLWVANEEREFSEAFGLGASGVVTDYPGRLRRFLEGGGASGDHAPEPSDHAPNTPGGEGEGGGAGEKKEKKNK